MIAVEVFEEFDFTVCKVNDINAVNLQGDFCFVGKTDKEFSLVCRTENVPPDTSEREDGWKGFRIAGSLEFSLVGILAKIANLFAEKNISIFAISTYDTDYIFVKKEKFSLAIDTLKNNGYSIKNYK